MLCKVTETSRSSFYYEKHSKQNAKDIFYSISMQGKVIEIRQWRGRDDKR